MWVKVWIEKWGKGWMQESEDDWMVKFKDWLDGGRGERMDGNIDGP